MMSSLGLRGPGRAVKLLTNLCFWEFGQHTQNDVASIGNALGIFKDMALDIFLVSLVIRTQELILFLFDIVQYSKSTQEAHHRVVNRDIFLKIE